MARPANPNKEKIVETKNELKEVNKVIRQGETAAKKKERLEERLAKLTGDSTATSSKKTQKVSSKEKDKDKKKDKKNKVEKDSKSKLQVTKKRGRPRKVADDDED